MKSSIGHKVMMAVTGVALVLFLTFHAAMNVVALISAEGYNAICEFLGANWYAVAATIVLALLMVVHFVLAFHLEIWNLQARGPEPYALKTRHDGVEWSSQNMFALGAIVLLGLGLHLFNFWSKMMYTELAHTADEALATNGIYHIINTFHGVGGSHVMGYVYTALYLVWLAAIWFHLNHGIWSAMQTMGLNNRTWFPRLVTISNCYSTIIVALFAIVAICFCAGYTPSDFTMPDTTTNIEQDMNKTTIYDFTVQDNKGNDVSLAQYKGKVILVVNTATACGFTPQYEDLDNLYDAYKDKGFVVLDFPCNQFGAQAPGTDDEIQEFCTVRFGTEFPRFHKIDVNGDDEIALYTWLKSEKGFAGFDPNHPLTNILDGMFRKADPDYDKTPSIKWNFTKFLIDAQGNVVERFEPTATQDVLAPAIEKLLK